MKRTAIKNLICSMIATVVLVIGVLLIIIVTNDISMGKTKLVLSSASATAVYSGKTLSDPTWFLTEGDLKEGHTIAVNVTGAQTNVGISENYISASVKDANGKDVTGSYDIEYNPGILNVKARELILIAGSAMKLYDGTPLTCNSYSIQSAVSLMAGDTLEVVIEGSIVDLGEEKNQIIDARVQNKNGEDVTQNYSIHTLDGKLIVYDLETLVFKSDSDSKMYDGTPLVNENWTLVSGELEEGHSINITVTGSQTEVGSSENTFTVQIVDQSGVDVTNKYQYYCQYGTLTVIDNINSPTGAVMFRVTSDINDTVYLKMKSYGDYDMQAKDWKDAVEYDSELSAYLSAYYFPSLALENGAATTNRLTIEPVAGLFALPYYSTSDSCEYQRSDVEIIGNGASTYLVDYYSWDNTSGVGIPSAYQSYENRYAEFARDNYLYVDDETKAFMEDIIAEQGFDASSSTIIKDVANYIQKAAVYNMDYDVSLDSASNPITAFLSEYKEGVCRHYALAATHLYRSLGIPARYTVGFVGDVLAGETVDITDERAHAWVEVYVNDIGWINIEVTGSSNAGGPGGGSGSGSGGGSDDGDAPQKIKLTVTPRETEKDYDGTELMASQEVTGIEEFLTSNGYTYEVIISGSRTLRGDTISVIEQLIIRDELGTVIYDKQSGKGEDVFQITYNTGTVRINAKVITITAGSAERGFIKGEPLTCNEIIYNQSDLVENEFIDSFVVVGERTLFGESANSIESVVIKNEAGKDVTSNYSITLVSGTLKVTK